MWVLMSECARNAISMIRILAFQIDGVESLNNVLLIGMTNRKDLLDEALLRLLSSSFSLLVPYY